MKLKHAVAIAAMCLTNINPANAETETKPMQETAILTTISTMTDAFAKGDIDGIMSTYEPAASVLAQPGQPVTGDEQLRAMFADFIASGINFEYGAHDVVISGDIALHLMKWTAPSPEGDMSALSVAVLRKQTDGTWKMVIDHPFGDTVMQPSPIH